MSPGRARECGRHLGGEVEAGGGGHLVGSRAEEAGKDDVKPMDQSLLPRLD